jgi:hypothetical protein
MRWYEIRISGGNSSIYQQGTYSPDATHRWMGSVCADKNGSIALAYSASSTSINPAIRYAGRLSTDALGTMGQGEKTLHAGTGSQTSYSRWGDYSHLTIDPADDETFWYTTEYYASNGTNWQTRIGSFKITAGSSGGGSTLAEAVDQDALTFTTSGTGDWDGQTTTYYYDGDAAQSPTITHNQSSSFEVTQTGYTNVKFYWKVSSEANYDYLRFYIDGNLQDQIAGTVNWTQKSYNVTSGSHTYKWTYYKDGSVSSNDDTGWVDKIEFGTGTVTDPIGTAVDLPSQIFTLSGDADWSVDSSIYYYGGSSAVAPASIGNNQDAVMETTISGVTSVKFWWRVSSETNYDFLEFYIDGVRQDRISGSTSWAQKSYTVSTGSHTLKWVYTKDYSVSSYSDIGWVDKLELQ